MKFKPTTDEPLWLQMRRKKLSPIDVLDYLRFLTPPVCPFYVAENIGINIFKKENPTKSDVGHDGNGTPFILIDPNLPGKEQRVDVTKGIAEILGHQRDEVEHFVVEFLAPYHLVATYKDVDATPVFYRDI